MHYFIDGYNMLFHIRHAHDDLQSQRESIIYDLNKKISVANLDVSIVFDSAFQIGGPTRSHFGKLEILFTAEGETADEFIVEEIKNSPHPNQETVVTSDKKLAWRVRNRSAHTESVEGFIFWLNRVYKNKLRQLKKGKLTPRPSSQFPTLSQPALAIPLTPSKEAPLEAYTDYYAHAFEAEWEEMQQQEKNQKSPLSTGKRLSRKPRRVQDPFQTPSPPEPKAATEMERWLKLFEKRLFNPDFDT